MQNIVIIILIRQEKEALIVLAKRAVFQPTVKLKSAGKNFNTSIKTIIKFVNDNVKTVTIKMFNVFFFIILLLFLKYRV